MSRSRAARRSLALAALTLVGVAASPARANGRFPRADQLVQVPGRPTELWLRTTFGLLYSSDAGQRWDWVCERAIGFTGQEDPALGVLPDGTVLAGLGAGLSGSRDGGCSWTFSDLPSAGGAAAASESRLPITDLSVRADAAGAAVALAWEEQAVTTTTPGYRSRFFATEDGGERWVARGEGLDPSVLGLTLDLAPSDPQRLYASGIHPGMARTASLFVSTDAGASWTERPVPFDARNEQGLYVAAVDPNDANLVYLRTSGASSSRLLVTHDAGMSFEESFSGGPMLGFALAPDGSRIYLGGPDDGLWVAARDTLVFERRSDVPLQCLLRTADALYACSSDAAGGFVVGASTDDGLTFAPRLHLSSVGGPLACADGSPTALCASDWPMTAEKLGIDDVGDGSNGASGSNGAPPGEPTVSSATADSGCGLARGTSHGAAALALAVALSGAARARAVRRRRCRGRTSW